MIAFSTAWWLLAALAVIAELLSGTIYLLLIAAGFAAGALAAHLGLAPTAQAAVAALAGSALVLLWWRLRRPALRRRPAVQANPDLNLDIGQTVTVQHWTAEGTATVMHRGAQWTALAEAPTGASGPPAPGSYRIVALAGSQLVLAPA